MPRVDPKTGEITLTADEFASMKAPTTKTEDPSSPFSKWGSLFAGKQKPADKQQKQKAPELTADALSEATKGINFFSMTPEVAAQVQTGDMSGFTEAINSSMRNMFNQATLGANALVKQSGAQDQIAQQVADQLARLEGAKVIKNKTQEFFNVPGGDTLVAALTSTISQNSPNETPEAIGLLVSNYLTDFTANFGNKGNAQSAREVAVQAAETSATDF